MVTNFAITGSTEILQVAEAVAREKGIQKDAVVDALKEAIITVGKKKYGHEQNIRAEINDKTGEISLFRDRSVVDEVVDLGAEISLKDAKLTKKDIKVGEVISEPLPPIDFGRVTSQTVKQVVIQKVREAEREKQFEDFKDRVGEIVTGIVKRIEYGNMIIDFGKTETMLPRDEMIPREVFRVGDRIRAYIVDVRREAKGPQIFLSRTHSEFLTQLFSQEVPEIYDGIVSIKGVARDPGSRAKLAVTSSDSSIDPVGACIGPRGARVTAVYNELQGEKIDIIQWSPDLPTYAVNALTSKSKDAVVEVSRIVIDEDKHLIEAVVPDEHLSLAIGRRGQNVRLASELVGWNIDVVSESEESTKRIEEFNTLSTLFTKTLNVEEVIGQLLATEGFRSLEEVAYVPEEDLISIEGFDEDLVKELRKRAVDYLEENRKETEKKWKNLEVSEDLKKLSNNISDELMVAFGEKGIKSLDDFADLSRDEFVETFPDSGISKDAIDEMIMAAREHWFEEGEKKSEDKKKTKSKPKKTAKKKAAAKK